MKKRIEALNEETTKIERKNSRTTKLLNKSPIKEKIDIKEFIEITKNVSCEMFLCVFNI